MQADQLKDSINRIEHCADEAKRAVQQGSVPQELRQQVDQLHQQASKAKHEANDPQQMGQNQDSLKQQVMQLEQTADRAKHAFDSDASVDPQAKQAVLRAHDEISNLKKQIQMG